MSPYRQAGSWLYIISHMKKVIGRILQITGLLTLFAVLLSVTGLLLASRWLEVNEPPEQADAIVMLAGDPIRAIHVADLYLQGYAPVIYLS